VLLFVVGVILMGGKRWQRDVVGLDDLDHELVEIFGITIIGGMEDVEGMLDLELESPADDRDVSVAVRGDGVFADDLGRGDLGISLLEHDLRVADLLRPLADDRARIFLGPGRDGRLVAHVPGLFRTAGRR
jgi:hypothetical protein